LLVLGPEKDVPFLNISVEDGLKYIISGGVVVPRGDREPGGGTSFEPGALSGVPIRIKKQGDARP